MKRTLGLCLAAVFVIACGDQVPTGPSGGPYRAISDGAHTTPGDGTMPNPDFFFLPPMVPNPTTNVDQGEFNPNLQPVVQICSEDPASSEDNAENELCSGASQVALFTMTSGPGGVTVGIDVTGQRYHVNWNTDQFDLVSGAIYRVRVFATAGFEVSRPPCMQGELEPTLCSHELGFADVKIVTGGAKNAATGDEIPLQDGRTLPIKFRIENDALCFEDDEEGFDPAEPCISAALADGGSLVLESETDVVEVLGTVTVQSTGAAPAGALLQSNGTGGVSTITMKRCKPGESVADFVGLPTFGECIDIDSDPPLSDAGLIGTASMCTAFADAFATIGEQARRLVVHNLRQDAEGMFFVVALPEADGFCPESPSPSRIGLGPFDRLMRFARAGWQAVREQVATWLRPGPLWASLVCDAGNCGGPGFDSPVQAALPAQMDPHADNPDLDPSDPDIDRDSHRVNTTLPPVKVLVTDGGGAPVQGATLTFDPTPPQPPSGSVTDPGPVELTTAADGIATFTWTLGSHWGVNTLSVRGDGIADPDDPVCTAESSGPCTVNGVYAPDHATGTAPVELGTGEIIFSALGVNADLVVQSLTHAPADPNSLDPLTFTAVVTNLGPGPTEGSMLEVRIEQQTTTSENGLFSETQHFSVPGLPAGGVFTQILHPSTTTLQLGSYRNTAIADANNDVPEKLGPPDGETNNVETDDYIVTEPPDLVIQSLTHDPAEPFSTETITFTAVVKNNGPGPSRATTLDFSINGDTEFDVPPLAAGATFTKVRTAMLSAGTYQNTAIADVNLAVPETNETNNQTIDTYVVTQAPIFLSTFSSDAADAAPGAPEKGSWTLTESAGTIRVRSAVGDLTDKPVELNQVAGLTGGVDLRGTVAGTPPSTNVYVVSWRSLIASADAFFVPVVLRDNAGLIIASLEYRAGGSLTYNNADNPVTGFSWTQNVSQSFEIIVNLDAKTTSLKVNGTAVTGLQNVAFVQSAANLARIAAEMGGTSAQVFAWDDIKIVRQ